MTAYKKETSELLQKELVSADSIFDYFETPLEELCNSLFLYYKKLIENNSDLYKIVEPNYFFFNNKTTVNAWAQAKKDSSIISLNIGTINELRNLFLNNDELTEKIFGESVQKLNEILIEKKSSILNFMYHSSVIFLMNHEIGHLIQNNENSEKKLNESIADNQEFDVDNHIYEVDSDVFASMKLSQDIHRIWKDFDEKYRTDKFLCNLISLAVAGIGIFKLFNLNAEKNIYYKEKSHPHVAIRYIIIQETMIDYTSHLRNREISEELKNATISNSFDYIDILNKWNQDDFFENFASISVNNAEEMTKYSNFLLSQISRNKNCSYYKIKNLKK
ncbi:MAG: hypothetical protein JXR19_11065 [Bacteroidia bacterium]